MADIYTGDAIDEVDENPTLAEVTKDTVADILKGLADENGNNRVELFDPQVAPPPDTDLLLVRGDVSDLELNLDNLGQVPVIDAGKAESGINVNLHKELDPGAGDLPAQRVIIGSSFDDRVIGGKSNLLVDLGEGNDFVQTGAGDDQIYLGAGDDLVRLGGGGTDYIDGGTGEDAFILSGSVGDWLRTDNEDGSLTWTNVQTGQVVTTRDIERFAFEDEQSESKIDESAIEDQDPDDL